MCRTVRKPGPNLGKQFFVCSKPQNEQCGFFEWLDSPKPVPTSSSGLPVAPVRNARSSEQYGSAPGVVGNAPIVHGPPAISSSSVPLVQNQNTSHLPGPLCKCGFPAVQRTVKKQSANKGKQFFVCSKEQGQQCAFFEWADQLSLPASLLNGKRRIENDAAFSDHQAVEKRPRSSFIKCQVVLDLEEIDLFSFNLTMSTPSELKDAVKKFDAVKVTKTKGLFAEKMLLPVDKLQLFESYLKAKVGAEIKHNVPPDVLHRTIRYRESEKKREERGDLVTTSLDQLLPCIICEKLMDFQWHGVHFALKRGGRCLIGDDMGLGKTLQAIAVARVYVSDWPLLIICPSSLRLNWKEELLRWLEEDLEDHNIHVVMSGKDINKPLQRVNIVSYDLIRKIPPQFLQRCKFIIADESHYLKNTTAKRSKAVTPLLKKAKRALLLSGTPALSRPVELFPQLNAISPILFPDYRQYVERYCGAFYGPFGYDVSGHSNLSELHTLLRGSVLIRRKKEEVLTQLPDKQRQVLWVQTKPKIMKDVAKATLKFENAKNRVSNASSDEQAAVFQMEVRAAQNELYSLTGMAKLDSILEFCKETSETGCKFIVFAHHVDVVKSIESYLVSKLKLGIIRIDGKTNQGDRQMLCKKFQTDPSCRVALLSITAAGVGLTLTKATVVLFAELYWNPGSLLQAEDRAHRIGQKDCVLVKYLLAKSTIDESMWSTVRRKLNVIGQSLTGSAARMDVTDDKAGAKDTVDKKIFSNLLLNKNKVKNTTNVDDEIEDLDEDSQVPLTVPSVPAKECIKKAGNASSVRPLSLPTSLNELDVHDPPLFTDKTACDELVACNDINLRESYKIQEQLDADIALAQKLQAQFDTEDAARR